MAGPGEKGTDSCVLSVKTGELCRTSWRANKYYNISHQIRNLATRYISLAVCLYIIQRLDLQNQNTDRENSSEFFWMGLASSLFICELENMPEVLVYNGKNQPTILETSNLPHIIKHNVSIYNNNSCKNNERVTTTLYPPLYHCNVWPTVPPTSFWIFTS